MSELGQDVPSCNNTFERTQRHDRAPSCRKFPKSHKRLRNKRFLSCPQLTGGGGEVSNVEEAEGLQTAVVRVENAVEVQ